MRGKDLRVAADKLGVVLGGGARHAKMARGRGHRILSSSDLIGKLPEPTRPKVWNINRP
jgi:hypothetical protein